MFNKVYRHRFLLDISCGVFCLFSVATFASGLLSHFEAAYWFWIVSLFALVGVAYYCEILNETCFERTPAKLGVQAKKYFLKLLEARLPGERNKKLRESMMRSGLLVVRRHVMPEPSPEIAIFFLLHFYQSKAIYLKELNGRLYWTVRSSGVKMNFHLGEFSDQFLYEEPKIP